MNLSYIYTTVI